MLQTQNRLTKARDFNLLMRHGYWLKGDFLDVKVLDLQKVRERFPKKEEPAEFAKQLRLAFTAGVKISKSAVKRNRIKRQLREILRLLLKSKKIKTGYYLLFVARPGVLRQEYNTIEKELLLLLGKAKLI